MRQRLTQAAAAVTALLLFVWFVPRQTWAAARAELSAGTTNYVFATLALVTNTAVSILISVSTMLILMFVTALAVAGARAVMGW